MRFLSEAEGEGFEPSSDLTARNGFRDRRIRPLCHPSRPTPGGVRGGEGGIRTLEGGMNPLNALAGRCLQPLGHFSGQISPAQGIPSSGGKSPVGRMAARVIRGKITCAGLTLTLPAQPQGSSALSGGPFPLFGTRYCAVMRVGRHEVRVSNPDKLFFPERGLTKADLVGYY